MNGDRAELASQRRTAGASLTDSHEAHSDGQWLDAASKQARSAHRAPHDRTEPRRGAEMTLADSSERSAGSEASTGRDLGTFELLVRSVKDYAILLLDLEGRVRSWNVGAEVCMGYRAEEIIGQHFASFSPPPDREAGQPARELELATREGRYEAEGWRLRKDGSQFWASVSLTALRNADGKLVGFGKVTRDLTERVRTNEQFRLAMEAATTGMMMIDQTGEVVLVNAEIERLFGYSRHELIGRPVEALLPARFRDRHPGHRAAFHANPQNRLMGVGRDLYALRKDGTEVPIEIGLNPFRTSAGNFVLSSVVDITERKRADQERDTFLRQLKELNADLEQRVEQRTADLTATLQEREVLLQEVHHRVKNNLSVITSLMEMQARLLSDGGGRHALEECQGRVHAIALIHEKLYQSRNYADVPFAEYIRGLANDVFQATGVSQATVSLTLAVDDVAISVDKAIPCGLILNELITNALKHAFPNGRAGTIRVELTKVENRRLRLCVTDDGIGLPNEFDMREAKSLGLRLVRTLAGQLEGTLTVGENAGETGGTRFELIFPEGR
jgi:PAS domain S-box-containing protein